MEEVQYGVFEQKWVRKSGRARPCFSSGLTASCSLTPIYFYVSEIGAAARLQQDNFRSPFLFGAYLLQVVAPVAMDPCYCET